MCSEASCLALGPRLMLLAASTRTGAILRRRCGWASTIHTLAAAAMPLRVHHMLASAAEAPFLQLFAVTCRRPMSLRTPSLLPASCVLRSYPTTHKHLSPPKKINKNKNNNFFAQQMSLRERGLLLIFALFSIVLSYICMIFLFSLLFIVAQFTLLDI